MNSHHQEPLTKHTERKLNHTVYLLTMSHPGAIQTRSMMKSERTPSVLKETSSVLSVEDDIFEHTTSTSMKSGDPMEALQQAMISMKQSMEYDRMTRREAEVARQKQEEAWLKTK